ncbi:MAG: hypothetical protein ACXWEY_10625 [Bacteroidia bacterium]
MNITGKSILIWLLTNFTGTILYSLVPLGEDNFRIGSNPETFMILLIIGLLFSTPAIPFTYLNCGMKGMNRVFLGASTVDAILRGN